MRVQRKVFVLTVLFEEVAAASAYRPERPGLDPRRRERGA